MLLHVLLVLRLAADRSSPPNSHFGTPARPRIKPWYRIAHTGDAVVFEFADSVVSFGGKAATSLLPPLLELLDGTHTVSELEAALGEPAGPAVRRALELLGERHLLVEGDEPLPPKQVEKTAVFLAATSPAGLSICAAGSAVSGLRLKVAGAGVTAAELVRVLGLSGVGDVDAAEWGGVLDAEPDLIIVAPEAEELSELEALNRELVRAARPWFLVQPFNGRFAGIGPLYVPGETCCHECFRARRAANSGFSAEFWALEASVRALRTPPAVAAAVAGIATALVLRWVSGRDPALPGRFVALAFDDCVPTSSHVVYRVPRCPVCSPLAAQADPLPWGEYA